jgi:hypothetical protein
MVEDHGTAARRLAAGDAQLRRRRGLPAAREQQQQQREGRLVSGPCRGNVEGPARFASAGKPGGPLPRHPTQRRDGAPTEPPR